MISCGSRSRHSSSLKLSLRIPEHCGTAIDLQAQTLSDRRFGLSAQREWTRLPHLCLRPIDTDSILGSFGTLSALLAPRVPWSLMLIRRRRGVCRRIPRVSILQHVLDKLGGGRCVLHRIHCQNLSPAFPNGGAARWRDKSGGGSGPLIPRDG